MKSKKLVLSVIAGMFLYLSAVSQPSTYIDDSGIMRWTETNEELCIFGTNYTTPFSYWERRQAIGADQMKAIDEDVYHMARLGLDGYRVPVWDVFISDTLGNLVYNEHLHLYDYLQYKLKERGIKLYVTPIILFTDTDGGFASHFGGKAKCLADTSVFPIMENYMTQFLNHINPYTGIAYKDDPDIVAVEIVNEPAHWKAPELVTSFINRMYDAIRSTGCEKPILYNMTTCADFIDDVLVSKAEGGSFQWYPSGLTCNHDLKGNMLPNVDKYYIPFDKKLKKSNRPKFVYEFSPSDIGASGPVYPAMARSFREAGFQFAAQFAYDPLHAAYCNIEYRTHFLNLAYTPKKAIGMMIAAEVFHALPLNKSYGRYPKNNRFESFSLSAEKDLAEMLTDEKFLYSNSTETVPPKTERLKQIAGTGNSPVVKYSGTGAYFLDKLEDGVWRLEVMPDAFWVSDPFFVPYTDRETAVTVCRPQTMKIALPNIGEDFNISGLNTGNEVRYNSLGKSFEVSPGAYLLSKKGINNKWTGEDYIRNLQLKEFHVPERKLETTYVLHTPSPQVNTGEKFQLSAQVLTQNKPRKVELIILKKGGGDVIPMQTEDGYSFSTDIPIKFTEKEHVLRYYISVQLNDSHILFPGGEEGKHILSRRIYGDDVRLDDVEPYEIQVVSPTNPIVLFDAENDWELVTKMKRNDNLSLVPSHIPHKSFVELAVNNLNIQEHNYTIEFWCNDKVQSRKSALKNKKELGLYGKALNNKPCKAQVSLLMKDGSAYGGVIDLDSGYDSYKIKLKDLKHVKSVLMPRPYPKFHAYWFEPTETAGFKLEEVEKIQISIGPEILPEEHSQKHGIQVGWVELR